MLKQTQSLRQLQKLSPQQIQLMKLLQVPTASLEERIKDELESNPALDLLTDTTENSKDDLYKDLDDRDRNSGDESDIPNSQDETESYEIENIDISDYLQSEEEMNGSYYNDDRNYDDDEPRTIPIRVEFSFHDHLSAQLGMLNLDDRLQVVAEQIIGNIDDDGYLRREPQAIVDDLAFNSSVECSVNEVVDLVKKIQEFDPLGVAASNLQECLLLQLKDTQNEYVNIAKNVLQNYFEEFTKKHYDKIRQRLKLTEDDFREAIATILKLTPKPGYGFSSGDKNTNYVIPDFFVINNNGNLELTLNSRNAPELRISENYQMMLREYDQSDKKNKETKKAVLFIKQKIDSAKWFIDAIKQRQHTLLITMNAILHFQRNFFLTGDESNLKPMILKDISDITEMDISTVSRVANSKYVQTEYGTFLLKFFFSESIFNESGEEVSTREVKRLLEQLVADENKQRPLSDEKLMELVNDKGYNVARRTIAKYREQLDIPVARLRKMV